MLRRYELTDDEWNRIIEGSHILADRGYDSNQLIDYIYDHGGMLQALLS